MNKVVIKDYNHMTTMDENMNWMKVTHVLSNFSLNLRPPFVNLHLLQIYSSLSTVYTREKLQLSLMYIMYRVASNNTPSYAHVSLNVVWRVHSWGFFNVHNIPPMFPNAYNACDAP